MDSNSPEASQSELSGERLSRPKVARTEPDRAFSGVWGQGSSNSSHGLDDQIMSKGKQKAQQRSPDDIAVDAVDNGYDMIDEFLQQESTSGGGDAFGIPDTGVNQVGGNFEQLLSLLAGGGGLSANVAGIYSQYLQVWNSLFATFMENAGDSSLSGIEAIVNSASTGAAMGKRGQAVILSNRPLEVDVNWKQGVPAVGLKLANFHSMDHSKDQSTADLPKGLAVKVRQSQDLLHQVFDVKVPASVKSGWYGAILVDADGLDHGYLTIRIPN